MGYTVISPQPPGLQAGEVAVNLTDINQAVAVSVSVTPTNNNAGATLKAQARAIDASGSTFMHGFVPILTTGTHQASHDELTAYTADALAKGMMLAVLGEPLETVTVNSGGTNVTQTLPPVDSVVLTSWSIRAMLAVSSSAAPISAGSLLA